MNNIYTISETAKILGVHSNTLRRWDRLNILKSVRIGERGDRKYLQKDIENLLAKGRDLFKGPQKDIPHIGVGIILLNKKSEILLAKRQENYGKDEYALPGGRVSFGESPLQTAQREIKLIVNFYINIKPFSITYTGKYLDIGEHPITINFAGDMTDNKYKLPIPWNWYNIENLPAPLFTPSLDAIKSYKNKTIFNF